MRFLFLLLLCLPLTAQDKVGPLSGMRLPVWDWTQPSENKYVFLVPGADFAVQRAADGITWEFRLAKPPGTNPSIEPVYADVIGTPCTVRPEGPTHTVTPDGLYVCAPVVADTGVVSRVWRYLGW